MGGRVAGGLASPLPAPAASGRAELGDVTMRGGARTGVESEPGAAAHAPSAASPGRWSGAAAMAAAELAALLRGEGRPVPDGGCDLGPPEPPEPAHLRKNACYVVLAVLFNDQGEVLMVQEAKRECRGRWYLPAGRMEPRESIVQALQREVREESGLHCRPLTLLAVEERGAAWIRFAFLAQATGGALKTPSEADAESLQARWWDREAPRLPLRAPDILPLMELALRYRRAGGPPHPPALPAALPCAWFCQRLLLLCAGAGGALWVLLRAAGPPPRLPLAAGAVPAASAPGRGLLAAAQGLLRERVLEPRAALCFRGLLGLQHLGEEPGRSDGVCFNVVATVGQGGRWPEEAPPALRSPDFFWWEVEEEALKGSLLQRLEASAFIPLL